MRMIHTIDYPHKTMRNMWWMYLYSAVVGVLMFLYFGTLEPADISFLNTVAGRIVLSVVVASALFVICYYVMRDSGYYWASIPIDGSARVLFFVFAWIAWIPLAVSWWRMKRATERNERSDREAERTLKASLGRQLTESRETRFPTDALRTLTSYCISEAKVIEKELTWDELSERYAKIMSIPMVERMGVTDKGDPYFSLRAFYIPEWSRNVFHLHDGWTCKDEDRVWLAAKYYLGDYGLVFYQHHRLQLQQTGSGRLTNERRADILGTKLVKYVEKHYADTLQPLLYAGKIDEVVAEVVKLLNDGHCVDRMYQEQHFIISQHYHATPRPIDAIVKRQTARVTKDGQDSKCSQTQLDPCASSTEMT